MSTTFTLSDTKNTILTVNDLISLTKLPLIIGRNSSINFEDWANGNHYNTTINLVENFNLGVEDESLRGVNLFYENSIYKVKINSPANRDDWKLALNILSKLCSYLSSDIYNIEEKKYYNSLNIYQFNQENEINEGIVALKKLSNKQGSKLVPSIPGFNLTLFIDENYLKKCHYDKDEILKLSTELQWGAYAANPSYIVKKDRLLAGYYVLSAELETYLPKNPILPNEYKVDSSDNVFWIMIFRDGTLGHIGAMDYQEFVSKNYNLDLIDGNHFKIILNVNQMKKMIKLKKKHNKFLEIFNEKIE